MTSVERALTAVEQTELQARLGQLPTTSMRVRKALANALVLWAVTLLVFTVAWYIVAWLATKVAHVSYGWTSASALLIFAVGAAICGAYAALSTLRWMRNWQDTRPLVHRDLAKGIAVEETLVFTAAKRFQEPEHGGLIYFLRTNDDRVFVLYDHESQDLGVQGNNPLESGFRPRVQLRVTRAPLSKGVLKSAFSGPPLELEDPLDLTVPPNKWPETEEFCEIAWDDLEVRLGSATASA